MVAEILSSSFTASNFHFLQKLFMTFDFDNFTPHTLRNSQKGQDSVFNYIFNTIGTTNKFYVEFGGSDGFQMCNTLYFRENLDWKGILIDCNYENESIGLFRRHLTTENIVLVFEELKVPKDLDLLCIDVDGNDYWFLQELLKVYTPRVFSVECNVRFEPDEKYVLKYDENWNWDGKKWYGASPLALKELAGQHGYTPVYLATDDLFFVKDEFLDEEQKKIPWEKIYPHSNKWIYEGHVGDGGEPLREIDLTEWTKL